MIGQQWIRFVVCVAAIGSASVVATHAASIVLIEQRRTLNTYVATGDGDEKAMDSNAKQAIGDGLFDTSASIVISVPNAYAHAIAWQNSELGPSALVAESGISVSGGVIDPDDGFGWGVAESESHFEITFSITAPTSYSLKGEIKLDGEGEGTTYVQLSDASKMLHRWQTAEYYNPIVTFNTMGFLNAGEYKLEVESYALGGGDVVSLFVNGHYSVAFVLGILGTGGEVPDGDDISPGQPLEVEKLDDGLVGLRWGMSCRPEDGDYAVYEGQIGDPSTLAPRTCSTGGVREYELAPTYDGSFFLVVPHDGGTEGSYGDTSTGAERPASVLACYTQFLGDPVCSM